MFDKSDHDEEMKEAIYSAKMKISSFKTFLSEYILALVCLVITKVVHFLLCGIYNWMELALTQIDELKE